MLAALTFALVLDDPRAYEGVTAVPCDPTSPAVIVAAEPDARSPDEPEAIFPRPRRLDAPAPEERTASAAPRRRFLEPVGPPGQARVEAPTDDRSTAVPIEDAIVRWHQRRRALRNAVVAFGTIAGVGAALTIAPFLVAGDQEDGTGLVPFFASGAALLALGGAGTVLTAPWLGHHLRWDRPSGLARSAPPHAAWRSRRHTRRLFVALAIEGGLVVVGGLSVGMGFVGAVACADVQDLDCTSPRVVAGGAVGYPLIGLGALAMVSTGILIGLQKGHGHTKGAAFHLASLSPTSMTIRF